MVSVVLSRLVVVTLAQDCDGPNVDDKSQDVCNDASEGERCIYFYFCRGHLRGLAQDCDGPNVDDKSQNVCNDANEGERCIYFLFL